jgi:DNA-binding transcriptional regulator YdaS (Cro superfamily)
MANDNLKDALRTAGLTSEQFAQIIDVDPKTVQRWVSGRTPYPRHRATIARALDLTEHELWPDDVPSPASTPRLVGQTHTSGDVIASWGRHTDPGAPDLVAFITNAVDEVDLLDNGRGLAGMPGLTDALLAQAHGGCQIRVLTPSPSSEMAPLIGSDQIELCVFEAPAGASLI